VNGKRPDNTQAPAFEPGRNIEEPGKHQVVSPYTPPEPKKHHAGVLAPPIRESEQETAIVDTPPAQQVRGPGPVRRPLPPVQPIKIEPRQPAQPQRIVETPTSSIIVASPAPVQPATVVVPEQTRQRPIMIVQPVQPVVPRMEPEAEPGRIDSPNNSVPKPTIQTIRPNNSGNNSNNSVEPSNSPEPELKKPNETVPLAPFEKIGRVGRQRKYEEKGNRGENSVRDVVLYRHIKGRHYPGLSSDMKRWYEFFYFKSPMKGEKPFNANTSYEQHIEAYERGQEWIRRHEFNRTTRPVGHSGPIDLQARRAAN
jgi:hypothetical protein